MTKNTVHILRFGRAFCGQSGAPCDWPLGEKWIAADDPELDIRATCKPCRKNHAAWKNTYAMRMKSHP